MNKRLVKGTLARGFTLIELLIVMAILGVLAVVVLVAINPVQQLARTRDAGRKSAVTQVGGALEAYYTTHGGKYLVTANCQTDANPDVGPDWMTCLKTAGELSTPPGAINYTLGAACATDGTNNSAVQNGFCYTVNAAGDEAVVYARLESDSEASKCDNPGDVPYFIWSTRDGRGGLRCITGAGVPNTGTQPWNGQQ